MMLKILVVCSVVGNVRCLECVYSSRRVYYHFVPCLSCVFDVSLHLQGKGLKFALFIQRI